MKKKIIAKVSEGLGNQFFMYANSYAIAKKFNLDFYIDPFSGYFKKNVRNYLLNNFNITSEIAPKNWIFDNHYTDFRKKFFMKLDYFKNNKSFMYEKKNSDKSTFFNPISIDNISDTFYIDGNFESEKYFLDFRSNLLNEFSLINDKKYISNKYINKINTENVVSICVRQNRFSERVNNYSNAPSIERSKNFVKDTIAYIKKAEILIENKIKNPKYYIWSDSFNDLREYFPENKYTFIINDEDKILNDFFLLKSCKYFIVGPSTFHWWGAWLSDFEDKICIRPQNLNPSNNIDFWPNTWLVI
ncbi:alpha-1,2-fucosyltransferase [Candidatus Pelagibacter sp.]|nr:alpha-1,2-fucosyltransferase [Candidatus Pelagibacter sp.]